MPGVDSAVFRAKWAMSTEFDRVPVTFAAGELETSKLQRQSHLMANTWAQLKPDVLKVPGANHLMVVEGLANSESELHSTVVRMLALGLTQISRCLSRPP
jgi:hypothetical protein